MTTRQRILNHLKKTRAASAREIARALNLSAPNVRHHLGVLASDGRVEAAGTTLSSPLQGEQRGVNERGRPEKLFALAQSARGDNLSALTEALLAEAGSKIEWEAVARRLIGEAEPSNLPIAARLRLLVDKLNERHYQSRWEAGADGPRVLFGRCPYAAVIEGHPELCQMDAFLLSNFLRMEARQSAKIGKGQGACVFGVR